MIKAKLDGRLLSASKFVRQGAIFADVGTDHAHLPIFLLETGKIERAILSDINERPLLSARKNIIEAGLSDRAELVLCDGLTALSQKGITDVAICGMGGEIIAEIIDNAPFLKDTGIRLILQPMSRQGKLRGYLADNGFSIIKETYSYSQGKYYVTICAEYTGNKRELSLYEKELGRSEFLDTGCAECRGYLDARLRVYEKIARGKSKGGDDACNETLLYQYIKDLRKDI